MDERRGLRTPNGRPIIEQSQSVTEEIASYKIIELADY